jgi:hypothetical protein
MSTVLRTHTTDETRGFMKALIGIDDRILGFTMIGAEAGEVMTAVQTAMRAASLSEKPAPKRTSMDAATGAVQSEGEFTMAGKLTGKVALVMDGSAGIGLGISKCFAEEGTHDFITGRRQSELDKAVTAIGGHTTVVQGDTANLGDLDRVYTTIKAQAGSTDVLAVNAGVYEFGTLGEIRGAFRQNLQYERPRPAVHCAEGAAAFDQGFLGDPHRLDGVDTIRPRRRSC